MKTIVLYIITVLVWGSTWLGIKFQLGTVDPIVSVIYRFGIAFVILLVFCIVRKKRLKFSLLDHGFMFLLGLFLFSINYWLVYLSEVYLTSGLVAVLFSSVVFFNIANGAIFLGSPVEKTMVAGAMLGILGIILIFMPEISSFDLSDKGVFGLLVGIASVFLASLGNITSARNTRHHIPVIQANLFGMAYGTLILTLIALFLDKEFAFVFSVPYIGSLAYLSVFGSIVAFGCYLTLIGSIGPDKASYAIMVVPIISLILSSMFEGYVWNMNAYAGLVMVLTGNFFALKKKAKK